MKERYLNPLEHVVLTWPKRLIISCAIALLFCCFGFTITLAIFGNQDTMEQQFAIYDISALLNLNIALLLFVITRVKEFFAKQVLNNNMLIAILCLGGVVGNICYTLYVTTQLTLLLFFAIFLMSAYEAVGVIVLCSRIIAFDKSEIVYLIGLAGCVVVLIQLIETNWIKIIRSYPLIFSAFVLLAALPFLPRYNEEPLLEDSPQIKDRRKKMKVLLICGFCLAMIAALYPRFITNPTIGVIGASSHNFLVFVALIIIVTIVIVVALRSSSEDAINDGFVICSASLLMLLFVAIVLHNAQNTDFANAAIKANHIAMVYYFMLAVVLLAKERYFNGVFLFSAFGIIMLSLPEFFVDAVVKRVTYYFNLYEGINYILVTSIVAIAVISLVFIVMLVNHREEALSQGEEGQAQGENAHVETLLMDYYKLSTREVEIALLLNKGYSVKKMADVLCVAPSTIQSHARSLYRKMNIHSKQELIDIIAKLA